MNFPNPYASGKYKLLMAIPIILIAASVLFFVPHLQKGIDLKGGLLITLQTDGAVDAAALKSVLSKYSESVEVRQFTAPTGNGIEISLENNEALDEAEEKAIAVSQLERDAVATRIAAEAAKENGGDAASLERRGQELEAQTVAETNNALERIGSAKRATQADGATELLQKEFEGKKSELRESILGDIGRVASYSSYSYREVGSALSKTFLAKTQEIVFYSFLLSAIVVLIVFRSVGPSVAVVFGAVGDVAITAGVMSILGIPLTLATIATLLMLIGFSLDTDIMLTMRVYKRREGTKEERALEALKTGTLMNLTTIGAFGALLVIANWLQIPTYAQIGAVAVIGGFVDFIVTWGFNAGFVLWRLEKEEKKNG